MYQIQKHFFLYLWATVQEPYDVLFTCKLTKLCFLAISWSLLSIFPALMIMKTSFVVFMINTAVMQCVMSLFKARAV